MNRIAALLGASIAAISWPAKAINQPDNKFDFAVMYTPTWNLTATTRVNWAFSRGENYPTVASVECRGESRQFDFTINGSGEISGLHVKFLGSPDENDERPEITLLGDHLWLFIDGKRWEYANIRAHTTLFSNIHYPPPKSDIVILDWRGYQAVRQAEDQPWMNLKLIYNHLITARRIEWGFKSRDWAVVDKKIVENHLPRNWENTRYKIDNNGLLSAISWCARQVLSEDAYVLPRSMVERKSATPANDGPR